MDGFLVSFGLSAFWGIVGWLGLGLIIAAGAVAVAIFVPIPLVRKIAIHTAIIAAASTMIYGKGVSDRHLLCKKADLVAQLAAEKRDREIAEDATRTVKNENDRLAAEKTTLDQKVRDYEDILSKAKTGGSCALSPADLERLRDLGWRDPEDPNGENPR